MALDIYEKATKERENVDNIDHLGEVGDEKLVVRDCLTLDSRECAANSVKSNCVDNSIEKRPEFCGISSQKAILLNVKSQFSPAIGQCPVVILDALSLYL